LYIFTANAGAEVVLHLLLYRHPVPVPDAVHAVSGLPHSQPAARGVAERRSAALHPVFPSVRTQLLQPEKHRQVGHQEILRTRVVVQSRNGAWKSLSSCYIKETIKSFSSCL